jgi:hypothetical protein
VPDTRGTEPRGERLHVRRVPHGVWPGPFCTAKPPSGVFTSWVGGDKVDVVGDLFTIGWKTYFWNAKTGRFDGIFTND